MLNTCKRIDLCSISSFIYSLSALSFLFILVVFNTLTASYTTCAFAYDKMQLSFKFKCTKVSKFGDILKIYPIFKKSNAILELSTVI